MTGKFLMTPDQHRRRAQLLRRSEDPEIRALAVQHDNLARLIERRQAEESTKSDQLTPSEIEELRRDTKETLEHLRRLPEDPEE